MRLEALADLLVAFVLWGHLVYACVGVAQYVEHLDVVRSVAVGTPCVVAEESQGVSAGWDGAGRVERQEVLTEKLGVFVGL